MITAEIEANNAKVRELAFRFSADSRPRLLTISYSIYEKGIKVAQNAAAGVAGLVVWPLLFAMDFKGAADADIAALQATSAISDKSSPTALCWSAGQSTTSGVQVKHSRC
jgi:hypothetical protein